MKYGYDIDGKEIIIAMCRTCGHEVGILREAFISNLTGSVFHGFDADTNELRIIDKVAECCEKPNYYW